MTDNPGWSPRMGLRAVVHDDKLWIMGGRDKDLRYKGDVWYTSDGATWTCATYGAPWVLRCYFAAAVFENKIWVLGGFGSGLQNTNDVWYSSDGKNWTCATASAAWSKRRDHEAFVYDNKLWVAGGYASPDILNDVWHSKDGKSWTKSPDAPWRKRMMFSSAIFANNLWIIGGVCGSTYLNDVWYCNEPISALAPAGDRAHDATPVEFRVPCSPYSGSAVTIAYTILAPSTVTVSVFDCGGRILRTVWNGIQTAGTHTIAWDWSDAGGGPAGAGAFFIRLETQTGFVTKKLIKGH